MVEIFRRNFLASMVPVIVNAILNEHQLVIDIVAFVIKGDFHRSRLGEKQRGKILAGWVTRKMRTIAQYSIRDPNGQDALGQTMITEEPVGRVSTSTSGLMRGPGGPGSIKNSPRTGSTLGMTAQMNNLALQTNAQELPGQPGQASELGPGAPGISEMPAQEASYYPERIPELGTEAHDLHDKTPTDARQSFLSRTAQPGQMDYSPINRAGVFDDATPPEIYQNSYHPQQYGIATGSAPLPDILRPGPADEGLASHTNTFYSDSTPYDAYANEPMDDRWESSAGHGGNDYADYYGGGGGGGGGGGLRVANRDSSESESADETWRRDALAGLSLVGQGQGQGQGQQGAGHQVKQ